MVTSLQCDQIQSVDFVAGVEICSQILAVVFHSRRACHQVHCRIVEYLAETLTTVCQARFSTLHIGRCRDREFTCLSREVGIAIQEVVVRSRDVDISVVTACNFAISDDVDDAADTLSLVLCRGVGDHLNLLDRACGHTLDDALEVFGHHRRRTAIDQHFVVALTIQQHVALGVDAQLRHLAHNVDQLTCCGVGVVFDTVCELLVVGYNQRFLHRHDNLLDINALLQCYAPEFCAFFDDLNRAVECSVSHRGDLERVVALCLRIELELTRCVGSHRRYDGRIGLQQRYGCVADCLVGRGLDNATFDRIVCRVLRRGRGTEQCECQQERAEKCFHLFQLVYLSVCNCFFARTESIVWIPIQRKGILSKNKIQTQYIEKQKKHTEKR